MAQKMHRPEEEGALAREVLANSKAHVTSYREPGTMDITRQQQTFVTFVRFVTRMTVVIIVILILLAIFNG
jgi:membrane protein required for beta-lactamase induction